MLGDDKGDRRPHPGEERQVQEERGPVAPAIMSHGPETRHTRMVTGIQTVVARLPGDRRPQVDALSGICASHSICAVYMAVMNSQKAITASQCQRVTRSTKPA